MVLSDVIAIVAALVAGLSVVVAIVANGRAKDALDLQKRIDDRAREFRHVEWAASTDASNDFSLGNIGLTDAEDVVVVFHLDQQTEMHRLGRIEAGGSVKLRSLGVRRWMVEHEPSMPLAPGFRVHWSSPLGEVDQFVMPPASLFDIPEE